ncbi:MAG: UPF0149 family protein [Gammaproteobacteria bacterium]
MRIVTAAAPSVQRPILSSAPGMGRLSEQEWTDVDAALQSVGALGETAEIHGEFCGLACIMGEDAVTPWANSTLGDARSRPVEVVATLEELARCTWASLDSGDMSFELLLPPDEESLERRAEALGIWCQGFVHGLGMAGRAGNDSPIVQDDVIRDIVGDFSEITRAGLSDDETEEEGEAALIELVEYVRVSVQLIFEELHSIRTGVAGSGAH